MTRAERIEESARGMVRWWDERDFEPLLPKVMDTLRAALALPREEPGDACVRAHGQGQEEGYRRGVEDAWQRALDSGAETAVLSAIRALGGK